MGEEILQAHPCCSVCIRHRDRLPSKLSETLEAATVCKTPITSYQWTWFTPRSHRPQLPPALNADSPNYKNNKNGQFP
jgi:hypothetical protein